MAHLHPERLAQYALGDDTTLDAADQGHLAGCDQCREEVEELRRVLHLGHELTPGDNLKPAPPQVWDRIVEELALSATARPPSSPPPASGLTGLPSAPPDQRSAADTRSMPGSETSERNSVAPAGRPGLTGLPGGADAGGPGAGGFAPDHRRRGRGRFAVVAVAATVGLIAGALGMRLIDDARDSAPQPLATTQLEPIKGKAGEGTAELVRVGSDTELRVGVNGLTSGPGFYELWLINVNDNNRMISLGVLNPRTGGTFVIPADATPEQGYRIVDVSLEPVDGEPKHSTDSVVRGTLPA